MNSSQIFPQPSVDSLSFWLNCNRGELILLTQQFAQHNLLRFCLGVQHILHHRICRPKDSKLKVRREGAAGAGIKGQEEKGQNSSKDWHRDDKEIVSPSLQPWQAIYSEKDRLAVHQEVDRQAVGNVAQQREAQVDKGPPAGEDDMCFTFSFCKGEGVVGDKRQKKQGWVCQHVSDCLSVAADAEHGQKEAWQEHCGQGDQRTLALKIGVSQRKSQRQALAVEGKAHAEEEKGKPRRAETTLCEYPTRPNLEALGKAHRRAYDGSCVGDKEHVVVRGYVPAIALLPSQLPIFKAVVFPNEKGPEGAWG